MGVSRQQQLGSEEMDIDSALDNDDDKSEHIHGELRGPAVPGIENTSTASRDAGLGSQKMGNKWPSFMAGEEDAGRSSDKNQYGGKSETDAPSLSTDQSNSFTGEKLGQMNDDFSGDARVSTTETEMPGMLTPKRYSSTYPDPDARNYADLDSRGTQGEKRTEQKGQAKFLDRKIAVSAGDDGFIDQDNDEMLWTQTGSTNGGDGGDSGDHFGQADRPEPRRDGLSVTRSSAADAADRNEDPAHMSTANANGDIRGQVNPGDGGARQDIPEWRPRKGDLVEVERRTMPGMNKLGGTGRVVKVNSETGTVDVRYVVEGGWERGIDPVYVTPAVLDLSEVKRPTLGRCQHCGSLRVDCRQGCEHYTAPPSRWSPSYMPFLNRTIPGARPDESRSIRNTGPTGEEGLVEGGQNQRKGRERHGQHRLPAMGDDLAIEQDKRRRHRLREDWNEEGLQMPGSEEKREVEREGEAGDGDGRGNVDHDWERSGGESLDSSGDGSHGTKSDDQRRWRSRRRRKIYDESDSEHSDSDVELLAVRNASRHDHHSRDDNSLNSSSSDQSNGDETDPGQRGSGPSARYEGRRHGGRSEAGDAQPERDTARFLMPEGEEASRALPSDIVDPTRGMKNPVLLRRELMNLLKQLEKCVVELEKDVPPMCR